MSRGLVRDELQKALLCCAMLLLATMHPIVANASQPFAAISRQDGYVDAAGTLIYYESIGNGAPLLILHGGPGVPHGYFLPYLLTLARHHRLVFVDERGSGRSERLADPKGYTLDAMVADVEAVRVTLGLGRIDLLGHSYGGILAQAYATQHQDQIRHLILAGTAASAADVNADFKRIMESLTPQLRRRIQDAEAHGIIGPDGAQLPAYRKLADEAEMPYNYVMRPPAFDDTGEPFGWDVLNEMWGSRSDFHIDGNLAGFDFTRALHELKIPTLIVFGDHDLMPARTASHMHDAISGSTVVEIPRSGHMMFVDQPTLFIASVEDFLNR